MLALQVVNISWVYMLLLLQLSMSLESLKRSLQDSSVHEMAWLKVNLWAFEPWPPVHIRVFAPYFTNFAKRSY